MNKTHKRLQTLIYSYAHLPKHILVHYAYECALECKELMHKEGRDCLEIIRLWLIGEATEAELREAGDKAYTSNYSTNAADYAAAYTADAVYAAYAVYNAAYTVCYTSDLNTTYANAYIAAYYASKALYKPTSYYYDKFINYINNLTTLEKMLYLKEDIYE